MIASLLAVFSKIKSYGLIVLGAISFVLYNLYKHACSKNTALSKENSDLHAANEAGLRAMKEKEKDEKALRNANLAINNIDPQYKYPK